MELGVNMRNLLLLAKRFFFFLKGGLRDGGFYLLAWWGFIFSFVFVSPGILHGIDRFYYEETGEGVTETGKVLLFVVAILLFFFNSAVRNASKWEVISDLSEVKNFGGFVRVYLKLSFGVVWRVFFAAFFIFILLVWMGGYEATVMKPQYIAAGSLLGLVHAHMSFFGGYVDLVRSNKNEYFSALEPRVEQWPCIEDFLDGEYENNQVQIFVEVGQQVERGQRLALVELHNAYFEVESPLEGTIVGIFVKSGDPWPSETPLFDISFHDQREALEKGRNYLKSRRLFVSLAVDELRLRNDIEAYFHKTNA